MAVEGVANTLETTSTAEARATSAESAPLPPRDARFFRRLGLMALSAGLMTLAYAPVGQFYLAWIALAPWLLAIRSSRSAFRAGLWGWLGGALIVCCNNLYLTPLRVLAPFAGAAYLGISAGVCALLIHSAGLLTLPRGATAAGVVARAGAIAAIWVTFEWARGNLLWGIPWLYLSHTQLPLLPLCQIADITGAYGVSFLLMFVNALLALTLTHREERRALARAWIIAAVLIAAACGYGWMRLSQPTLAPGPTVLAVQPNDRNVTALVTIDRQRSTVSALMSTTADALQKQKVDLVAWPESTMPALNDEAHKLLAAFPSGFFYRQVHHGLQTFTRQHAVSLITGGQYLDGEIPPGGKPKITLIRNSAYFYDRDQPTVSRYDKVRLMPFGEFVPMRSLRVVRWAMTYLTPNATSYEITTDPQEQLTVFNVRARDGKTYRFVAPICYDDLDSLLIRRMLRSDDGRGKRADFIVNLSNEAWFDFGEPQQHIQTSAFRCIENRVPAARSVNGGISTLIDSCGRVTRSLPINHAGVVVGELQVDSRIAPYTRIGDAFAYACIAPTLAACGLALQRARRRDTTPAPAIASSAKLPGSGVTTKSI